MKNKLLLVLVLIVTIFYAPFFLKGKIPLPGDTLVGSYFPWLDYKWGYQVGVPVKNPPLSDAFSQFFVWKYLNNDLLKQGIIPLWNSYEFAGTPQLASFHTSAFLPANLILFLPRPFSWGLYIFASSLFAALFMYLFLGSLVKNNWARLAGSVVAAFAGPMTTWVEFGTGVFAAGLLPLSLFLINKFDQTQNRKYLFFLSLSFACLVLAGHAQIIIYSSIIIPIYTIFTFKKINRQSLFIALSLILALGITAFQTLPTYSFLKYSIRDQEQYSADFNFGLTPAKEFVRLIAPDFFGHPATYNHFSPNGFYHEFASFIGTLSLPLILALFFIKNKTKYEKFFMFAFLISVIMAIDNPLSQFFYSLHIPLITYSYASRIFFITSFTSGVLVCLSLSRFLDGKLPIKKIIYFSLLCIFWILILTSTVQSQYQQISLRNSILPVGLLILLIIILLIKLPKKIAILLISLLLILDLYRFFSKHNPFISSNLVFPKTPVIEFLQAQEKPFRITTTSNTLLPPNSWDYYELESIEGYNPLRLLSYNRYFNLLNSNPYFSKPSRFSELENDLDPKYLDSLNVGYIVSLKPGKDDNNDQKIKILKSQIEPVFEDKSVLIYKNKNTSPRSYFSQKVLIASSELDLSKVMENQDFDPTQTAVLLEDPQSKLEYDPNSKIDIISHQANKVILKTSSTTQNLAILADAYDQGWQASIDGQKTKVYLANAALRGVVIPAGEHQLIFEYKPESFTTGLKISLISLILLLFLPLIYKISLNEAKVS
jgi:hypothetical protein